MTKPTQTSLVCATHWLTQDSGAPVKNPSTWVCVKRAHTQPYSCCRRGTPSHVGIWKLVACRRTYPTTTPIHSPPHNCRGPNRTA